MATKNKSKYGRIQVGFWTDDFVQELTIEQAYFYLYLFTGKLAKSCGVFSFTYSELAMHTKSTVAQIKNELFPFFIRQKKIIVHNNEIAVLNFHKHNNITTGKPVMDAIGATTKEVKNTRLLWAVAQFAANPEVSAFLESLSGQPDDSWDESWYESWDGSWDGSWHDSSAMRFTKPKPSGSNSGGQDASEEIDIHNELEINHDSRVVDDSSTHRGLEDRGKREIQYTLSNPQTPFSAAGQKTEPGSAPLTHPPAEAPVGEQPGCAAPPPPQPAGWQLHTKSLQIAGIGPLSLSFLLDDSFLAKQILAFLNGSIEQACMLGNLGQRPPAFVKFVIEHFIAEVMAAKIDRSAGKLLSEFSFLLNYRLALVEKKFNEAQKDEQWFEQEFEKHVPKDWPKEEREKFRLYYTAPQPAGRRHYQTVNNFVMANAVQTWASNNSVNRAETSPDAKGRRAKGSKKHVVAHGGMSKEELERHYFQTK